MFYPDDMGGSGRYLREICEGLADCGHKIFVITRQWKPEQPLTENFGNISVYRYTANDCSSLSYISDTVKNTRKLFEKLTQSLQFDIINFHQPLASIGITTSHRSHNLTKVYTFHSPWHKEYAIKTESSKSPFRPLQILIRRIVERAVIKKCSSAIVLSQYMANQLKETHNNTNIHIEMCPGGADIKRFKPSQNREQLRAEITLPKNRIVLLTVRGLTPRTGIENLIRAMQLVVKKNVNVSLIIGGGGVLKNKLLALTKELNLENNIKFLGFINDDDLVTYYQVADYFILPTKYLEGFGLVTPEALASGLPVLATPVGGTIEILTQLNKDLLFKSTEPQDIAALILKYATLPKNVWQALSQKCHTFINNTYTWQMSAQKTEKHFLQLNNQ
jgi:glycosyltransferase involved in cell wall biosynthesis